MEMTFMNTYERVNHAGEAAAGGAALGSVVPGIGTAIGAVVGALSDSLITGQNQAATSGIETWLRQHGGNARLPYYPSKAEMTRASALWEPHIKDAIQYAYDEPHGSWESPFDAWKGAVISLNPIRALMFKGSGEVHELDSNVIATDNAQKAITAALKQQQLNSVGNVPVQQLLSQGLVPQGFLSGSNQPSPYAASVAGSGVDMSSPILWIVLAAVVIVTIVLIVNAKKL